MYNWGRYIICIIILYCIDRHIYFNLFKSTQSAAGLKALKPAANGRYLMCKSPYFHLLYIKFDPPVSKVHAGSFRISVIHRTLTGTTGSLTCINSYVCVYIRGPGRAHWQWVSTFWLRGGGSHKKMLCSRWDSNLWSSNPLDFEADALPIDPPSTYSTLNNWSKVSFPFYIFSPVYFFSYLLLVINFDLRNRNIMKLIVGWACCVRVYVMLVGYN